MMRRLGKLLLALVLALVVLEVSLQLAAALYRVDRGDEALEARHRVVLCLGDSHTWGLGQGYPARLAERLGERSEDFRVINLGVPGTNTAQLRSRFERYLDLYDPSVVVIWSGINNRWNRAESEGWEELEVPTPSLGEQLLAKSRLWRLLRVWREHEDIAREALRERERAESLAALDTYVVPQGDLEATGRRRGKWQHQRSFLGLTESFVPEPSRARLSDEEVARVTRADLAWILGRAEGRGVPVVLVAYPRRSADAVNRGIREAASTRGVPVIESSEAMARIHRRKAQAGLPVPPLFKKAHPTQPTYAEVGDMIVEQLDETGRLPVGAPPPPTSGEAPR